MSTAILIGQRVLVVAVIAFMLLPIGVVVIASFNTATFIQFPPSQLSLRWYEAVANDSRWGAAAANSVFAALVATTVTVIVGLLVSIALVRGRFRGRRLLYGLVLAPLIVPQVITALGLYALLAPMRLAGSVVVIGVSQSILALPVFVTIASSVLGGFDAQLEQAAVSLGAPRYRAMMTVTVPVVAAGIIAGALFAFMTAFDDVIIALLLSSPQSRTLPVAIWNSMAYQSDPTVTVVSTYMFIVTVSTFGVAHVLNRRPRPASGARSEWSQ